MSELRYLRGALIEYTPALPPLALVFEYNPQSLSRTRSVTLKTENVPGHRGYSFTTPMDVPRVAQGATVQAESFSIEVLIDATELLMQDDAISKLFGIEPQLDVLRSMVEPKVQGPAGLQVLASLGAAPERAFSRAESASVLLLVWGTHILPVFLTAVKVDEKAHLPRLQPYRATVSLTMQVIEGDNPFYKAEKIRQAVGAAIGAMQFLTDAPKAVP